MEGILASASGPEMLPFYLRAVAQKAVEAEKSRRLAEARAQALAECRRLCPPNGWNGGEDETAVAGGGSKTAIAWPRLLTQALTQTQGQTLNDDHLMNAVLCAMPWPVMMSELPAVATSVRPIWERALLMTSPVTVESLTLAWEEAEAHLGPRAMQPFFAAVFEGPGEGVIEQDEEEVERRSERIKVRG